MYKKIFSVIINAILIFIFFSRNSFTEEIEDVTKKSINHTPEFYGTVGITLNVNDELDLKSPVFRIFAKDFIDGDLSQKIEVTENTVNMKEQGEYYVKYKVSNSSNKTAEITVPVTVTTDGNRFIKKKIYGIEKSLATELSRSNRGYYHDRQNLGLYLKKGASLKVRQIQQSYNEKINIDILNDDSNTEKQVELQNDWNTINTEYDSVPFIRSSDIKIKEEYNLSENMGYNLWQISNFGKNQKDGTIYFANVFDTKNYDEEITKISIPVYGCDNVEVYVNTKNGNLNSEEYTLVKKVKNPLSGWLKISLKDAIKIEGSQFVVAVKYTGATVPINESTRSGNYTYVSNSLNSNWNLLEGTSLEDEIVKYTNIPPIICESANNSGNNPILEIDITDMYKEDSKILPLDYYLYGDNEDLFFEKWNNSNNSFAIMENDRATFLIPIKDKDYIINKNTKNSYYFKTISELFDFYNKMFEQYDSFLGLEENTENLINQNTKEKYFIKANKHGAGYAYYTQDHTGFNGDSIKNFFYKNWMILHEIGHGYEGEIAERDLKIRDINNNIFAYYYEKTYLKSGDYGWLGKISDNEDRFQKIRKDVENFNDVNDDEREYRFECALYFFVNLLNKTGAENCMSTLYRNLRNDRYNGNDTSIADLMLESFSESSKFNLVPYFESWKVTTSDYMKQKIQNEQYDELYYLNDLSITRNTSIAIQQKYGLDGIYSLVTKDEYQKYFSETITGLSVTSKKLTYFEGEDLDLKTIYVRLVNYNGGLERITDGYTIDGYDKNKIGKQNITISFAGFSQNLELEVQAIMATSIEIEPPSKLEYMQGENINLEGLKVVAYYNNETSKELKDEYKITGYDKEKIGKQTVTIEYDNCFANFEVLVKEYVMTVTSKFNAKLKNDGENKILQISPNAEMLTSNVLNYDELKVVFVDNNLDITYVNDNENWSLDTVKTGDKIVDSDNNMYIVVIYGDVNGDGKICDVSDINLIIKTYLYGNEMDWIKGKSADIYFDGKLDSFDINRMMLKYLGYDGHEGALMENKIGDTLLLDKSNI